MPLRHLWTHCRKINPTQSELTCRLPTKPRNGAFILFVIDRGKYCFLFVNNVFNYGFVKQFEIKIFIQITW